MVRLGWVARSWPDALILHVEALGRSQILVRSIAPELLAHLYVEELRECLSQPVSQSLDHDVVVVVTIGKVLLAKLFLPEAG